MHRFRVCKYKLLSKFSEIKTRDFNKNKEIYILDAFEISKRVTPLIECLLSIL